MVAYVLYGLERAPKLNRRKQSELVRSALPWPATAVASTHG